MRRSAKGASRVLAAWLCVLGVASGTTPADASPADYVNPLQGTDSRFEVTWGNTYPTVAMPWGMHTWTPQTGANGDGWKYQYHCDSIRGFQQAHQCSSWTNDYCVFSLMPVVGALVVDQEQRATKFRHEDEDSRPYRYRVRLASGVQVDFAPTQRGAVLQFDFPADQPAHLVLDGYTGRGSFELSPDGRRITGAVRNGRNLPRSLSNHLVVECDPPATAWGTWQRGRDQPNVQAGQGRIDGWQVGTYLQFPPGSKVLVRTASSYIDAEQAQRNFDREVKVHATVDSAAAAAKAAWDRVLGAVAIEGGTEEQRRTFYSCLFRASLFPRRFYEIGADGAPCYRSPYDGEVHAGRIFTDTGLWDTFRAQMPLNALLRPAMHGQYCAGLLAAYDQCGWLPSWSFPGEAGSMIGNHAISVLADAWAKGIRTFDPAHALAAYQHESLNKGPWGPANGREGWEDYERLGYVSSPKHREAAAKTLEYAYDDYCGHELATAIGDAELATEFGSRMGRYRNLFDPATGFFRGKNARGEWTEPFRATEWGGPYTEGCAWHWVWSVMHDVQGLIELLGGDAAFVAKLDAVFETPGDFEVGTYGAPIHEMREMKLAGMGQYAHGNQPIQHMVYLYNYAGEPWKSQYWARQAMDRLYSSQPKGYPGDEDQGQTSSWYALSALGFYCVCPGTDEYVLGSPLFDRASIRLPAGKRFVIKALRDSPQDCYIQSAQLNGEPLTRTYVRHSEIAAGGTLELVLGPDPNKNWGVGVTDRPFSVSNSKSASTAVGERPAAEEPQSGSSAAL